MPVQRRIADILSAYDDLIENNRRRMALLEDAARHIYREWFVRLRFPGYEHTRITDGVPEGWEMKRLEAVCTEGDGIQTGPFGSQLHQSDYSENGVPVVMPKDLIGFRISLESIARIPEDLANKLGRHRMVFGDRVYGRRGDIGRRAFVGLRQVGWFCGTGCLRFRPDPRAINPRFLFGGTRKIVARNHQVLGVNNAVASVQRQEALKLEFPAGRRLIPYRMPRPELLKAADIVPLQGQAPLRTEDRDAGEGLLPLVKRADPELGRLGVFWHTQGSGKSYSMAFFVERVRRVVPRNFTFLVTTDRDDLDDQIWRTFVGCGITDEHSPRAGSGKDRISRRSCAAITASSSA